ncbi:DUF4276 family protein [Aquisphaera insulae]|uniref:DUF4276 family protein n=1 Tax=Aquisphaera insulae TaxID=2712864 RepID=UPI0013EA8BFD|nr:DUF4276 family protein [Aquisphaera insulae]
MMARIKTQTLRVGLLVECGRDGLEDVLCRRIFELLCVLPGITFEADVVPMDNKRRLIQECGTVAARLLGDGCDRVVILWDERPAWPQQDERLCWHRDRQDVLRNLVQARVTEGRAHLVCIEREFESWLLHDHRMLSAVLSTPAHRVRVPAQSNPHQMPNPKGTMTSLFRQHRGRRYVDVQHARDFARCLQDLNSLRRCESFRRFVHCLLGRSPEGWTPYVSRDRRGDE